MAVDALDHFTIRCADMERTRDFYCDVLGLTVGPRPSVDVPGYWLYCAGIPQVHLAPAQSGESKPAGPVTHGFDHVAFRTSDPDDLIRAFKERDIPYQERSFPDFGIRQLLVDDPDGIHVEINCREIATTTG